MDNLIDLIRIRLRTKVTDQDDVTKAKISPLASLADIEADESKLGFRLPKTLKQLYMQIGNGGFGPGYGLIGMSGGKPDDTGKTASELYRTFRTSNTADPTWTWPDGLLPICHWGCAIYSCIDCRDLNFRMRLFDSNVHDDSTSWDDAFFDESESFDSWINAWADGRNLWEEMYGDNGKIARILSAREQAR